MVKHRTILLMLMLQVFLSSCNQTSDMKQERANRAERAKGDIVIGAAAYWKAAEKFHILFWNGLEMAVEEINAAGGVLGRKIRLLKLDDEGTVSSARITAQQLADNPDVVAVIGHLQSDITVAVSITYSYNGMILFSPLTTAHELTRQRGFGYIFRNVPVDEEIGRQLAVYALHQGYKRVLTYFSNNTYGQNLANAFEKHALRVGCFVPDRLSYDAAADAAFFRKDLNNWKKNYEFDAIFVAGSARQDAVFIREARAMGIKVPIFAGPALNSPVFFEIAGSAAEGVVMPTAYHGDDPNPETIKFNKTFTTRYGMRPDVFAAQAYDAARLLAHAFQKAGTTVPEKVAQALYDTKSWTGVTGSHTFDTFGDVVQKPMDFQVAHNGKFEFLNAKTNDPAFQDDENRGDKD